MNNRWNKGQTVTLLLVFTTVGIVLTTAAVGLAINNAHGNIIVQDGVLAMQAAENGIENALISLLRDPSYSGGTLSFGEQTVTITVTGTTTKVIRSVGVIRRHRRILEVQAAYNSDGVMTPISWTEVTQ